MQLNCTLFCGVIYKACGDGKEGYSKIQKKNKTKKINDFVCGVCRDLNIK